MVSMKKYHQTYHIIQRKADCYARVACRSLCEGDVNMALRFAKKRECLERFLVCGSMYGKSQEKIKSLMLQGKVEVQNACILCDCLGQRSG